MGDVIGLATKERERLTARPLLRPASPNQPLEMTLIQFAFFIAQSARGKLHITAEFIRSMFLQRRLMCELKRLLRPHSA